MPDADGLAEESIRYLDQLVAELERRIANREPLGSIVADLDKLVRQTELASMIAGAAGLWRDAGQPHELITLDALDPVPTRRFPWVEHAARWLMDRNIYGSDEIQQLADERKARPRWQSLTALTTVRDEIASSFVSGESFENFHKRVKTMVAATKPELQMAFRTATHQAYIEGTVNTLEKPKVRLQFPFVSYRSAHDTRTRESHRPLDGLLFEIGSRAYEVAQRALADFNCRCGLRPVTAIEAQQEGRQPVAYDELPPIVLAEYGEPG